MAVYFACLCISLFGVAFAAMLKPNDHWWPQS
jgi:hypothetical protein